MSSSSKTISQKEYLKKYLFKTKKKKSKRLGLKKGHNLKVVDDDVPSYRTDDREYQLESDEDAPVIAAIIDERPREIRDMEIYKKTDRWKPIGDTEKDRLQCDDDRRDVPSPPRRTRIDELFDRESSTLKRNKPTDKMNQDRQHNNHFKDRDLSPPGRETVDRSDRENFNKSSSRKEHFDKYAKSGRSRSRSNLSQVAGDLSPSRKSRRFDQSLSRRNDISPPRRVNSERYKQNDRSRSRSVDHENRQKSRRIVTSPSRCNDDLSPPFRGRHDELHVKGHRYDKYSTNSRLPIHETSQVEGYSSKENLPRREQRSSGYTQDNSSPVRRNRYLDDRIRKNPSLSNKSKRDKSPRGSQLPSKHARVELSSSLSPPRENKRTKSPCRNQRSSKHARLESPPLLSSSSSPGKSKRDKSSRKSQRSRKHARVESSQSSSSLSPLRKDKYDKSPRKRQCSSKHARVESSPRPSNSSLARKNKRDKSPRGSQRSNKHAIVESSQSSSSLSPLQKDKYDKSPHKSQRSSKHARVESSPPPSRSDRYPESPLRPQKSSKRHSPDVTSPPYRKSKIGKTGKSVKRRSPESASFSCKNQRSRDREDASPSNKERHLDKLPPQPQERAVTSKSLARYADDEELNSMLKEKELLEDPMYEYFQKKKRKKESKEGKVRKPIYQGAYPQNRFGIPPGHQWDGVDRSNGYEARWFKKKAELKCREEEAYKWGTEDM